MSQQHIPETLPTEPGHVMTRAHYEQLARQAAEAAEHDAAPQ